VSHDLRAPLRAIDGFAKALLEDYGQSLDDQAGHYLGRVRDATRRMGELIDDLLELSRIARAPLSRQRVDISALARRILGDLAERDPERNVRTCILDGVVVDADRGFLPCCSRTCLEMPGSLPQSRPTRASRLASCVATTLGCSLFVITAPDSIWRMPGACLRHFSGCTLRRNFQGQASVLRPCSAWCPDTVGGFGQRPLATKVQLSTSRLAGPDGDAHARDSAGRGSR
jgi:hypothetical protein